MLILNPFLLFAFKSIPIAQIISLALLNDLWTIWFIALRPYKQLTDNLLELFFQVPLTVAFTMLVLLLPVVPLGYVTKYQMVGGIIIFCWWVILFTLIIMAVRAGFLNFLAFYQFINDYLSGKYKTESKDKEKKDKSKKGKSDKSELNDGKKDDNKVN